MLSAKTTRPADTPPHWLLLDKQLCFALYASSLAMTKQYKPLLAPLQLTYPQYLVMLVLWENQSLSVSDLGERLQLDSGTLTPLLKRLEALGYLTRSRSAEDERRVIVGLSPSGKRLQAKAAHIPACVLNATACTVTQVEALTQQLHQLREQLRGAPVSPPL